MRPAAVPAASSWTPRAPCRTRPARGLLAGLLGGLLAGCGGDGGGGGRRAAVGPEELPLLVVEDARFVEGDSGRSAVEVVLSLSAPSAVPVTVEYATRNGGARAGSDYRAASGTIEIPPGATTAVIAVEVLGDDLDEEDEDFLLALENPHHAVLEAGEAAVVIEDDDGRPTLRIAGDSAREGPGDHSVSLAVELSPASGRLVTVEYETRNAKAKAGRDYRATSGELTFAPGMNEERIVVIVLDDARHEPAENLRVVLRNARNAAIAGGEAVLTIVDDDPPETSRKPSKPKDDDRDDDEGDDDDD